MTTTPRPDPHHDQPRDPAQTPAVLSESRASLWLLIAGPTIWGVHFLASYITAAIWCAKAASVAAPLGGARVALFAYTVVALAAIAWFGWSGFRKHQFGDATLPHDDDTPGDRHRFIGFATLLLCGLSFVAVVYVTLAVVVIGTCR